jgi:hypothetical protein
MLASQHVARQSAARDDAPGELPDVGPGPLAISPAEEEDAPTEVVTDHLGAGPPWRRGGDGLHRDGIRLAVDQEP